MGIGDCIMSSAAAERMPEGKRAVFGNTLRAMWSEVWEFNPKIAGTAGKDTIWIPDYPGHRPYILGAKDGKFIYNPEFRAPYGKLYLSDEEREWAKQQISGDYIVVEPNIKDSDSSLKLGVNKAWGKWSELLKMDLPWVQLGTKKPITRHVKTEKFRQAMAILAGAKLFVGTDGALHHAAAALNVPAVVLWGGVVSPKILGYPTHINIWNGAEMCGNATHYCQHCRDAMDSISVDQVKKHL
jgi:hypothetical protein